MKNDLYNVLYLNQVILIRTHNVKYQNIFLELYKGLYCIISSGVIALSWWNSAIFHDVESLTQIISIGTLPNLDMHNTKIYSMIHIITWLQELLLFVQQNMSSWEYVTFVTAGASMSPDHISIF